MSWDELKRAEAEKRREVKVSGRTLDERLASTGGQLDPDLFRLASLNLLELSGSPALIALPEEGLGRLTHLTSLLLHHNGLTTLSGSALAPLAQLKVLDASANALTAIPPELGQLTSLTTLNLSLNAIETMPSLAALTRLAHLDLGGNGLDQLAFMCHDSLALLADVNVAKNRLVVIEPTIGKLVALKRLDASDNVLLAVPGQLADLTRIKELYLQGNPFKDNRLKKLVVQKGPKAVLDYIRQNCPRVGDEAASTDGLKGASGKKSGKKANRGVEKAIEATCNALEVLHTTDTSSQVVVVVEDVVLEIRPFVVCCVIRHVDLSGPRFRQFIRLQTKLHETVCEKRMAATIATHDLAKISPGSLIYTARPPRSLKIKPLGQAKEVSATVLVNGLRAEAEAVRKEKKRNTISGIHQYLNLLKDKPVYPCLVDPAGTILSFPPITNSEVSKISPETKDILVEVTSGVKLATAKSVCDVLLKEMLLQELSDDPEAEAQGHRIKVEQVRIEDREGNLKVIYPSKTDLCFEGESLTDCSFEAARFKMLGFGELPKEYNLKIHGPYDPATYYGPKDTPLSQVKLGELPGWFARRSKNPVDWGRAVSRSYWRWSHKFVHPKYAGITPLFQVACAASLFYYAINYTKIKHHRNFKHHW
eukprot:snap_masked-scaffold1966_size23764-processed-gene-0.3 protein:Tk05509 transcript:snap_masked-scaffold1966_size23764-processed-gene-0.3-mRNA-1 annotation:"leucine-rich repeat-containing protein 47"